MFPDGFGRHTPELTGDIVVRAMSVDVALLPHFGDVLNLLANDYQWLETADTVDDIVQACAVSVASWYTPMNIGQIVAFIGVLPDGYLAMDGSTYDADLYPELFSIIDSQFQDIPANEFTLPDLGGVFPIGSGNGYLLGDIGGSVSVSLAVDEMPAHTHNYSMPVQGVDIGGAGPPLPAVSTITPGTPTSSAGSGNAHDNLPPYITLVYGVFSGRL
jgi:microcystin-dependent protein